MGTRPATWLQCAADHPLAGRQSIRWRDLAAETLYVAAPGVTEDYNAWLRERLTEHGVSVTEVAAPGNRAPLIVDGLAGGGVVVVMAQYYLEAVPSLRWVPFDPPECIELGVVWDEETTNPAVRSFVRWIHRDRSATRTVRDDRAQAGPR